MPKTILITSITGFLGAQILEDAVADGYRIKATVRNIKKGQDAVSKYPDASIELVEVPDLIHGDLSGALKGVDGVLHVASPYFFNITDPKKDLLDPAIEGTLNVLRQAQKAKVTKVIITSSFAAINNFKEGGIRRSYTYTEKDWNPATYEEASAKDVQGAYAYSASKKLAEKAAWDFAEEHPEMEISTMCPPMIYGISRQSFGSEAGINTSSANIWNLISGKTEVLPDNRLPLFCDARDVSRAHFLALEKKEAKGHRVPLCGGAFTWEEAADFLKTARPHLADKIPKRNPDTTPIKELATIDTRVARDVLGMPKFIDWHTCLLDTVDDLLKKQANDWK